MKCQHSPCRCPEMTVERSGKTYCSERCAALDAAGKRDEHCTCGHPSCGPAAA